MRVVFVGLAVSVALLAAPAFAPAHPGQVRTDAEHIAEDTAPHDPAAEPQLTRRTRAATAGDARAAAAAVVGNEHEVGSGARWSTGRSSACTPRCCRTARCSPMTRSATGDRDLPGPRLHARDGLGPRDRDADAGRTSTRASTSSAAVSPT